MYSGMLLVIAGCSVMVFSITVDLFHLGSFGFGAKQLYGFVVGAIITLAGLRQLSFPTLNILAGGMLVAYLAGILVVGLKPAGIEIGTARHLLGMGNPPLLDFVINFFGFSPLGYLIMSYLMETKEISNKGLCLALTLLSGLTISLALEIGQYFIPGRTSSLYDFIANSFGVLVGTYFYLFAKQLDCKLKQS